MEHADKVHTDHYAHSLTVFADHIAEHLLTDHTATHIGTVFAEHLYTVFADHAAERFITGSTDLTGSADHTAENYDKSRRNDKSAP